MSSSSVNEINSAFNTRLTPIVTLASTSRPTNPFASTGKQNAQTKLDEMKVRPSVTLPGTLGAQYGEYVVDAKNNDQILLDTYTIGEKPKVNIQKHTTGRLEMQHTRER
jgi:Fe-S cluster assembly iron-binding protein IscA